LPYGRLFRRIRQNRIVAAVAWRAATPLHAIASRFTRAAQKVRRNGGSVAYDGIRLRFPPNVGVDFLSGIHWRGTDGYEPNVWRVLRQLIPGSRTFIDVGAHIGFYAVLAQLINPELMLFGFEPVPELFLAAKKFFAANGLASEGLHQIALSDRDGQATLFLPLDYATMGSLAVRPNHLQCREIRVDRERMDTFFADRPLKGPVTIKIDVEDHEHAVLDGARKVIAAYRPYIVCELLPRPHNAETIELIHDLDYAAFAITPDGCFRMSAGDFVKPRPTRDFLLIPNERVAPDQNFVPFEALRANGGEPVQRSTKKTGVRYEDNMFVD
jgi:FkbM family methyltransferase